MGPDYVPPADQAPQDWHTELRQGLTAGRMDPVRLASWWTTLDDPILARLIDQAVANNLDLQQAMARVREARARRGISRSGHYPSLDASGSARRSQSTENSGGDTRSFYSLGFDAGWEIDIFGGVRRAVQAAEADLAASREDMHDVLVSLTAEVALNYLDVRTLQGRLGVARRNLAIQEETYDFISWRYQAGLSNELALQQSRYNLERSRAQIPVLQSSLAASKNLLAILLGKPPGSVHPLLKAERPIPQPPAAVLVGVPAETLRQRPDIRRAERTLAAQTARIGVATADLYPKFRLAGSIGLESLSSSDLFTSASETWNIGPSFSWNIFDGSAIRNNIEVQNAIQQQLLLAYEVSVLDALGEVENILTAYMEEKLRHDHLNKAVEAARQAEELARIQYDEGLTDFTTVLEAQQSLFALEDQLVESEGTITANLVRLYKALGGGWDRTTLQQIPEQG